MKTDTINQTIEFNASPKDVYDLIIDEKLHSAFTESEVTMSKEVNGKFSVFDGYCSGYNIELKEGEKIVQAWHFKEDGWPDDHYSECTFVFNKTDKGCKLNFTQTEIPEHKVDALADGWRDYYWDPMKAYLEDWDS